MKMQPRLSNFIIFYTVLTTKGISYLASELLLFAPLFKFYASVFGVEDSLGSGIIFVNSIQLIIFVNSVQLFYMLKLIIPGSLT
jgi:hypothetical protein